MADNTITVIGNLTREPDLRFTNSGLAQVRCGVAVNRRRQNAAGEWEENTSFFDVICWRDLAENVAGSLHKGNRVIVTGRLEQRSYETQQGEKRSVVEIIADEIGPSLRWASAEIARNERREGGGGGGGSAGGSAGSGGGSARPVPNEEAPAGGGAAPGSYSDEEPF